MSTKSTTVTTYDGQGNVVGTRVVTWEQPVEQDNEEAIRAAAHNALGSNRTFLAVAAPTNAQIVAQTRALTRQINGLIRLTLQELDGTD